MTLWDQVPFEPTLGAGDGQGERAPICAGRRRKAISDKEARQLLLASQPPASPGRGGLLVLTAIIKTLCSETSSEPDLGRPGIRKHGEHVNTTSIRMSMSSRGNLEHRVAQCPGKKVKQYTPNRRMGTLVVDPLSLR